MIKTLAFLKYIDMEGIFFLDSFPKLTYNIAIIGEQKNNEYIIDKVYIGKEKVKEYSEGDNVIIELYRAITFHQLVVLERCMQEPSQAKSMFIFQELINLLTVEKVVGKHGVFSFSKDFNIMWCAS